MLTETLNHFQRRGDLMNKEIASYFKQIRLGQRQSYKNLALYRLLSDCSSELDYLLLDEAMAQGLVELMEISEGGSVPELRVVNKAQVPVLILDGEELVGAKQNLAVNTTILVAAKSTVLIPVSCVERGRWFYNAPRFRSEERMMSYNLRRIKCNHVNQSVRYSGEFRADQGAIWDGIAEQAERMEAESPSEAMSAIYEKKRPSLEEYTRRFEPVQSQIGAIFIINGRVVGLDAFGKADTFSKVLKKLLQSYALDALAWHDPEKKYQVAEDVAMQFLEAAQRTEAVGRPAVSLGTDFRMESGGVKGFALLLGGEVLHLSLFSIDEEGKTIGLKTTIRSYSSRRRNRKY
jgi:hypothetical protein